MTAYRVDLDPALVGDGTYASRQMRRFFDVPFLLCVLIVLAILLPAGLAFPQLSDLGRPTTVVALMLAAIWLGSRIHPRFVTPGPQPLRWIVLGFYTTVLMSYAAGLLRGMPTIEANGAERALIEILAFIGPMLAFADMVPNRHRLDTVILCLVLSGGGMALMGVMQSFGMDATAYIRIPGLVNLIGNREVWMRGAYARVVSTAGHYIEFSAIMAMLLPFGIHMTRFARLRLSRQFAAISTVLMFCVIPMTLSRTGVVALGVVLVLMLPSLPGRQQLNVLAGLFALTAVLFVGRPQLLGSVVGLFTSWNNDPSVQGREDDYTIVSHYFSQRPWFGRGQGTFIPTIYTFLDNSWLGYVVSGGIVGTAGLAALHIGAILLSVTAWRRAVSSADRHLCMCLICAQVVAAVVAGTFDSMAFNTFTTVLAVVTGCAGAMWRLLHSEREIRTVGPALVD